MKATDSHADNYAVIILVLLLSVLFAVPGETATLQATVIGAAQNPKPFVRVEINGPQSMTIFTNNDGKFSVPLPAGQYKIYIIEMNQRMQFVVHIPGDNKAIDRTFRLPW